MKKIRIAENLYFSELIQGFWRLNNWNYSTTELLEFTKKIVEMGITTFDHADIYGNHENEAFHGAAISIDKSLRKKIQIITKCGIQLVSYKFPTRTIKYYEYSRQHIISSVEKSLKNFKTDYIDVLLLHRPAPFLNPAEVAETFSELKNQGKILYFGVSNFNPNQFEMLNSFCEEPLVTNQIELSPFCLEHFENGNIDFLLQNKIKPMIWSPLAGGRIFSPPTEHEAEIQKAVKKVANELNVTNIEAVVYQWIMKHPVGAIPIVGTGKIERIKTAIDALEIEISLEQWYKIFIAAFGKPLP